jgi:ABC-type amino acid transport substrate-binding protein
LLLFFFFSLLLGGMAVRQAQATATVVRIGIGFSDQINGSTTGPANNFDILFSYLLFTELGYRVEFVVAPYARLTRLLREKKIDVATRQAQQLAGLSYSRPYLQFQNKVFALAAFSQPLTQLADLTCCQLTAFQNAHLALGPAFTAISQQTPGYQEMLDHTQAIQLLLKGRTQLLVMDEVTFYRRLAELKVSQTQVRSFHLLPLVQYRLAFQQPALQQQAEATLGLWLQSDQISKIRQRAKKKILNISVACCAAICTDGPWLAFVVGQSQRSTPGLDLRFRSQCEGFTAQRHN